MATRHAIIYIPGLGDHRINGQLRAVKAWRLQGVEAHLFQMNWQDGEAFELKLQRLVSLIDRLHARGMTVSLMAASAGASAAMHAFAAHQDVIHGVVSICGKLRGPQHVHPSLYRQNPAFSQSMQQLAASTSSLDARARRRILSLHPLADEAVPLPDTRLPGVVMGTMPTVGHFFGIVYGLTLGSFRAIRFLKQLDTAVV